MLKYPGWGLKHPTTDHFLTKVDLSFFVYVNMLNIEDYFAVWISVLIIVFKQIKMSGISASATIIKPEDADQAFCSVQTNPYLRT